MVAIALELHEVLEEEFVRTGGEVLPSPDAPITDADLLDREKLSNYFNLEGASLVDHLEGLRKTGPLVIRDARSSLSDGTRRLLEGFDTASPELRLRINRRILEDVLRDSLRGAQAWPEITADQIVGLGSCDATLRMTRINVEERTHTKVAAAIEQLRVCINPSDESCPATRFARSPRLSPDTQLLIADYDELDDETRRKVNRRVLDEAFDGALQPWRDVRLGRLYRELHKRPDDQARTALCISGGGIRSATFALGVMQGLAHRGVLKGFDFLSTVSGGGYIGSWLSSWARRHGDGIAGVEKELAALDKPASQEKLEPEAKPIRHLREYSNYLTPRLGFTSGDTWTFASLYLRNLVINLLILVPLLAFVLVAPRIVAWLLKLVEGGLPLWVTVAVADLSLFALFLYIGAKRPVQHGSEAKTLRLLHLSETAEFILFSLVAGAGASIAICLTWAKWNTPGVRTADEWLTILIGGLFAVVAMIVIPCLVYFVRYARASYAERRESIAVREEDKDVNRSLEVRLMVVESLAALVAAAGAFGLYWFFANKVFDTPLTGLKEIPVSPFLLADLTLASPRILFICFGAPVVLLILYLQATVFVAGSSKINEDYDREWWGRTGSWLLSGGVAWLVLSGVAIFGPMVIYQFPAIVGALGGASGIVAILLGRSSKSGSQKADSASGGSEKVLALAVPLFCLFLLASISWLTTLIIQKVEHTEAQKIGVDSQLESVVTAAQQKDIGHKSYQETLRTKPIAQASAGFRGAHAHLSTIESTSGGELLMIVAIALAAFAASFAIGANRFSMHALYRNRLIRAYLGASRYDRDPDRLTGFDPYDNIAMYKLRPELLWRSSFCDVDSFIGDLQNAIGCTSENPMSLKLVQRLQADTRRMLTAASTLDAVLVWISNASREKDVAPSVIESAITAIANVSMLLPRTAKRLRKSGKVDEAVVAVARKEVTRRKRAVGNVNKRIVIDTVVQDINRIFMEDDLVGAGEPSVLDNRAAFDAAYPKWIVAMPPLRRSDPQATDATRMTARAPLHIVNTALNLVSGRNLAWQQRQAESFTVSPLHAGGPFIGYRDARGYGGVHGITLGTAVTISGAAASPNQGYHSSVPLAFLLTMFNVRLGWWLGNPGAAGKKSWVSDNPSSTVNLLAREMTGDTDDTYKWVYLSDGGHFENLGLYEMVLRRCRYIVVSDGGCDPKFTFEDLGNAIRKIRIDLGIPIEFGRTLMRSREEDEPWSYVAAATIRYDVVDGEGAKDGKLVYLKPGYYPDEELPKDVLNYAKECVDFPHETTADQWFSESQFESYRALGRHVIHTISSPEPKTVAQFVKETTERANTSQEKAYVPVVAQQVIRIKKDNKDEDGIAVILPSSVRRPSALRK